LSFLQERDDGFFLLVNLWKGLVEDEEAPGFLGFYDVTERILKERVIPVQGGIMERGVGEECNEKKSREHDVFSFEKLWEKRDKQNEKENQKLKNEE
jgi:hypothetical protein